MTRDEAIYVYQGQQLSEGIAPYASIFDAKTPLSGITAGAAVSLERGLTTSDDGVRDIHTVRMLFFLFSCLAVLAIYFLAADLFGSPLAGLTSAVVLAAFNGFARDAMGGPDPKTAGVFLAVATMALLVKRRWFWAGFAAGLAFLTWQPLLIYAALAIGVAAVTPGLGKPLQRAGTALAGAVVPVAITAVYFLAVGSFGEMIDAVFVFPATELTRAPLTFAERMSQIAYRAQTWAGGGFFWAGLGVLIALVALHLIRARRRLVLLARQDPLINVVFVSFAGIAAYTLYDFQGYPDLLPLLPYAALGYGGLAGLLRLIDRERLRTVAGATAVAGVALIVALAVSSFSVTTGVAAWGHALEEQQIVAKRVGRLIPPGGVLYVAGSPTNLVLLQRRNPDRHIYLAGGIAASLIRHYGGFDGWARQIQSHHPEVIVVDGRGFYPNALRRLIKARYEPVRTGVGSKAFVAPGIAPP
jgi:4-amino-4-deoxy-L-arabinose transferase-like glycosyltransferase